MHSITLTKEQLQKMIVHVASHAPLEACGLLAGRDSKVESVLEVTWIDANELDLLGIFHSHPTGPETVSPTDIAQAAYAVVYIILAPVDNSWQARGFWMEDGAYSEVALQVL